MENKKDNLKLSNETCNLLLQELLRIEDNKYCVDCDAKGPRWASWNIGVFLCIRCAGIHRNLGVHISKVKSVNLDSWTLKQLAGVWSVGNSLGRAIYEAQLPDNFRRPQTDSSLEAFIRAKYEHKRHMAPEYVPAEPDISSLRKDLERLEQSLKKRPGSIPVNLIQPPHPIKTNAIERPAKKPLNTESKNTSKTNAVMDLLNLNDTPSAIGSACGGEGAFNLFDSNETLVRQKDSFNADMKWKEITPKPSVPVSSSLESDLWGLELSGTTQSSIPRQSSQSENTKLFNSDNKVIKESILALYRQSPQSATFANTHTPYTSNNQSNSPNFSLGQLSHGDPMGVMSAKAHADPQTLVSINPMAHFGPQNSCFAPPIEQQFRTNTTMESWADPNSWIQSKTSGSTEPSQSSHLNSSNQWWNMNENATVGPSMFSQSTSSNFQQNYLSQVRQQLSALQLNSETNKQFQ